MTDLERGAPAAGAASLHAAYAAAYESLTFPLVTRARQELSITLAAQPVFELASGLPMSRRIRRCVRHAGGEAALARARGTLEPMDLKRIDLQTLKHGLDLLRLQPGDSGIVPAFWRTIASSGGRFALLCAELQHSAAPGALLVEVMGGLEQAPPEVVGDAVAHFETAALGAVLHVAPDLGAVRRLGGVRARCLALDFAGVAHETTLDWPEAARLIAAGRAVCDHLILLNLRPDRAHDAMTAGATHAVFADLGPIRV
ncbi:MAG TPA: hypothetical protein VGR32_05850 [Brevundimonas sp.]|jgi:hypothetical protein|uniref:hypothetical protein n=1 Tax=Brevundimonas sp. TaxID=1871086 RepID=UPI002DF540D9|nr:hypothetical protein [Brevundimonas sp.]